MKNSNDIDFALDHVADSHKNGFIPMMVVMLGVTQVGWFGVGVAMFALPVQKVTGWDINLLIGVSGVVMTATAWFGIRALTILSLVAVPAIAALGGVSVGTAFSEFGGICAWLDKVPAAKFIPGIAPVNSVCCAVGVYLVAEQLAPVLGGKAAKQNS